jgi:hypothetical protein
MPELIYVVAEGAPTLDLRASDPLNPVPFISTEMVQALKGLGSHVPPGMVIIYNPSYGFGWNDPRGWRVYFGISAMINVTYPTAPYYRMSQ